MTEADTLDIEPLLGECLSLAEVGRVLDVRPADAERVLSRTATPMVVGWDAVMVLRLGQRMREQPDLRRLLLR